MKKIMMTRLSVCSLGVSCNEMIDTPMLLVVGKNNIFVILFNIDFKYTKRRRLLMRI